ncbi:MAG: lauroyl acyltransferase, partial [Rikenellaceae bacterium]
VYFFDIGCIRRGYYKGKFVKLYDGDEKVDEYEITRRYVRHLEQKIVEAPQFWMWSHRRWKHKKS